MQTCKKGDPVASAMIKSTKIRKGKRTKFTQLELHTSPSWGIFLIYRQWLPNLPPILGRNLLFLGINMFFLIYDLFSLIKYYSSENYEIWKLGNLWINILHVFPVYIYLSITNLSYTEGWLVGGLKTIEGTLWRWPLRRHPGCSDPQARPHPVGESEPKTRGRTFNSFILHFIKFSFSKVPRPKSPARPEWRIRTGARLTPTFLFILLKRLINLFSCGSGFSFGQAHNHLQISKQFGRPINISKIHLQRKPLYPLSK